MLTNCLTKPLRLFALILSVVLCAIFCSAAHSSEEKAIQYYEQGDYQKARIILLQELAADPHNADAHYLLGNVFLALKYEERARTEYELASNLDNKGNAGALSRRALASFKNANKAKAASQPNSLDHSVQEISDELDSRKRLVSAEFCKRLQETFADGKDASAKLLSNCRAEISSLRSVSPNQKVKDPFNAVEAKYRNSQQLLEYSEYKDVMKVAGTAPEQSETAERKQSLTEWWSQYQSDVRNFAMTWSDFLKEVQEKLSDPAEIDITTRCIEQTTAAQHDLERRCEQLFQSYVTKLSAYEDSGISLDRTYKKQSNSSSLILSPEGTNIYSRSYQTTPESSGDALPYLAKPAALPVQQHGAK